MYYIEKEAEGEQLTLENTANEKIKKFEVFGNHKQETRSGKNLLNLRTQSVNGITTTKNTDGTLNIKGTATANGNIGFLNKNIILEANKSYTFSMKKISGQNFNNSVWFWNTTDSNSEITINLNNNTKTVTYDHEVTINAVNMTVNAGNVFDVTLALQVEEGTVATEYEQYGASPSPDYPSKVKCLGSNRQLFDKTKLTDNSYINSSGEIITHTFWSITDYIPIIPNFKYTYQGLTNTGNLPYSAYYDENKAFISSFKQKTGENTITIPENAKFIRFPIIKINDDINNFKFEEGTEATSYSPYGQGSTLISKINKNFLNLNNLEVANNNGIDTYSIDNPNQITLKNKATTSGIPYSYSFQGFRLNLPAGNYNLSAKVETNSANYRIIIRGKKDGNNTTATEVVSQSKNNGNFNIDYSQCDEYTIEFYANQAYVEQLVTTIYSDIQIEIDITTDYVEHKQTDYILDIQQEMLQGDYFVKEADSWKEVHTWKKYIFTGTESRWNNNYGTSLFNIQYLLTDINQTKCNALCNYFKYNAVQSGINNATVNGEFAIQLKTTYEIGNIFFKNETFSNVDDWKNWLQEKYDSGNPLVVYYPLETPTKLACTEQQSAVLEELNNSYTYDGQTNIFSAEEVGPIFKISYKQKASDIFRSRILTGKITRAYLKVLATDTLPEMIINESNYLKDLTFEELRYVPDEGFIGGTVAKRVIGNFNNVDSSFSIQDREFELYIGVDLEDETTEYIKYGTFIVQKPEDDQVTDNTSFEALDYMIKLNLPWTDRMTYPCTLKQLFDDLVDQSGLSTTVTSFLNQDFIVENNQFEDGTTRRDVLKAIAQVAFNWARIDENNNIVMDFEIKDDITETLTVDNYYNFTKQDAYGPVNVIVIRNSQVEGENVTIKDEELINISKTKNICYNNWIFGQYAPTGEISTYQNRIRTLYLVSINPNTEYYLNTFNNNYELLIRTYNKNKEFLRNLSAPETFTSNENEYYIGVTLHSPSDTTSDLIELVNDGTIKPFICLNSEEDKSYVNYEATGEIEFVISDNPFAYAQSKRQQLIEAGRSLFGLTYVPISMDMIGYIYLNCKDKIRVTNLNDETFDTYLLNHTITYEGTVSDSMESPAMTKTETQYKFTSPMAQALRHTEILVDKANQRIDAIIENVSENSEKIVKLELTIDGIEQTVSNIQNLTDTVQGEKTITLNNCIEGNVLELHILGNNEVFENLYPANNLYPSNTLYPHGDSRIVVTTATNTTTYELGITEVLRKNGNTYDEYILENGEAKVIRRINSNGTIKSNPTTENLGKFSINLGEGTNTITIKNYSATISAKFAIQNDYTDIFATKVEMSSSITQTAEEINLEVRKKVDQDEIISTINQSAEKIQINANKINLNGSITANGNFKIDTEGNMQCKDATMEDSYMNNITVRSMRAEDNSFYFKSNGKMYAKSIEIEADYSNSGIFVINNAETSNQLRCTPSLLKITDTSGFGVISFSAENTTSEHKGFGYIMGTLQIKGPSAAITCDGNVYANEFINLSKKEKKENIRKLKETKNEFVNIIKNIDICEYNLKGKKYKQLGVVIGEGYNTPDEILSENKEGVNLYGMTSFLYKGFQEYIEEQELKNKNLEEIINEIIKIIKIMKDKLKL